MVLKGCLSLIVLFLLIIPITFANFDYNETGNFNTLYEQGLGFFNAELSGTDLFTKPINEPKLVPMVSDLDHDGTNEIIIFDSTGVRLFNNKELDIVDSFPFSEETSNAIIFNIDGDNFTEIIIALVDSQVLHVIEYNGSNMFNTSLSFSHLNHSSGADVQIKCRDVNDCFMAYSNNTVGSATIAGDLYGIFFNSSAWGKEDIIEEGFDGGTDLFCKPVIPSIAVADYDGDNTKEYIFSFSNIDTGANELEPHIFWVDASADGITVEEHIEIGDSDATVSGAGCGGDSFRGMTSPITFDIDGSPSNGLETIIAYKVDDNEYVMKSFKGCSSEGCGITQLQDYPASCTGFFNLGNCPEATSLSNIVKADIFSGTEGVDDFCVMGYNDDRSELDMVCGSETSTVPLPVWFLKSKTMELVLNETVPFNLSGVSPVFHNGIIHSAQHSSASPSGKNLDEFVTSFGIISAGNTETSSPDLSIIFANPKQNTSLISVDAEKVGREDLIALASTNIWYIDDQFSNEGGQITEYDIDPCIDSTIQINSSSKFLVKVEDKDSLKAGAITDLVSARVIIYEGETDEQDTGWSNNLTSGTTFTFLDTLIYNVTTGSSTLRLMGRDLGNPDEIDIIEFTFSVGNAGVVKGDCSTTAEIPLVEEGVVAEAVITEATLTEDADSNAITRGVLSIVDLTGMGGTTLWLLGMMLMTLLIWHVMVEERHTSGSSALGTIAILNVLAIILGARLGMLGTGLIVILTLIGVIILGVFLGKFLSGLRSEPQ